MATKKLTPDQREALAAKIVAEAKRLKKAGTAKSEGYEALRKRFKVPRVTSHFKRAGWNWD